jgi:hypothetical protein
MKTRFDPLLQARLPLPLSRLYALAFRARSERERHDRALHLAEANLKLFAAALVGRYRSLGVRSERVDDAIQKLVMPALGHWRDLAIEALLFLGEGCDAGSWAGQVLAFNRAPFGDAESCDALADLRELAGWPGRSDTGPLGFLSLLPAYRNAMSGAHGGIKVDPSTYDAGASALLRLLGRIHGQGGMLAGASLCLADEVHLDREGNVKMMSFDLTGPSAIRRFQPEDGDVRGGILPGCVYLETAARERISLHPLLWHVSSGVLDRVLFLNRAREGSKGIIFLCYETGELHGLAKGDRQSLLARDVVKILDWSRSESSKRSEAPRVAQRSMDLAGCASGDTNDPDSLDVRVIRFREIGDTAFSDRELARDRTA